MAGQLNRSIFKMKDLDPAIASELQKAYESLKADDAKAAKTSLASVIPSLNRMTGNLGAFTEALDQGDYQLASTVFRDLGDPAKTPFDDTQLMVTLRRSRLPGAL